MYSSGDFLSPNVAAQSASYDSTNMVPPHLPLGTPSTTNHQYTLKVDDPLALVRAGQRQRVQFQVLQSQPEPKELAAQPHYLDEEAPAGTMKLTLEQYSTFVEKHTTLPMGQVRELIRRATDGLLNRIKTDKNVSFDVQLIADIELDSRPLQNIPISQLLNISTTRPGVDRPAPRRSTELAPEQYEQLVANHTHLPGVYIREILRRATPDLLKQIVADSRLNKSSIQGSASFILEHQGFRKS